MEKISINAPAKINLYLNVLRKRDDGYHEIETLMQAVDLYDKITLEKSDQIELSCSDPALPQNDENLAFKAAALIQREFPFPGVKIGLEKAIPSGAGLGGGSSDAAAVIRGLCRLYNLPMSNDAAMALASRIGSDVPFFLTQGQAIARGRGEILETISLPLDYEVIIISPPFGISTSETYQELKISLTKRPSNLLLTKQIDISRLVFLSKSFHNDLEDVVLLRFPTLDELKRSLLGAGAFYSSMSGSGSSFFGLFGEKPAFTDELENLKERGMRLNRCKPVLLPSFGS